TLLGAHPVGEANGNVSQEVYDDYKTVISAAIAIRDEANSTQVQVDEAVETLESATDDFKDEFITIYFEDLIRAINDATSLLEAHQVGTAETNVSQAAHDNYKSAIGNAVQIRDRASSTQAEVNGAIMPLASATAAFKAEIIVPIPTIAVDGSFSNHMPMILVGNVASGRKITVYDTDGTTVIGSGLATGTSVTLALDALTVGTHTLKVKSEDQAGMSKVYSAGLNYTVNAIRILPENQISESQAHIAALATNGQVYTWGYNYAGQIGDGTTAPRTTIFKVPNLPKNIIAVQAGEGNTTVLTSDGHIWKWGSNDFSGPKMINGIDHVVSISSQGSNIVAIKSDGTVSKFIHYVSPSQVMNLDHVIAVKEMWSDTAVVLKSDGTVWAWGANDNGQLGDGTSVNKPNPVQITGLPFITDIKTGNQHTLALSVTGAVYAWGSNSDGQVGNGTEDNQLVPYEVEGLSNITRIGAGNYYSFAIDKDGKIYAWGYNGEGNLGLNTNERNRFTPSQMVSSLTNVVAITGGEGNTGIALQSNGDVWTWGSADDGRLGSGETSSRSTPGRIANFNLFIDSLIR
ncbi:hypothetical protein FU659_34730, partial [Paenibacillus sp. N3.4]